eukprot:g3261.t1
MAEDDEFDAALTERGVAQARAAGAGPAAAHVSAAADLVIASPLSRAIDTADIVLPAASAPSARRVVREGWREIAGLLLNAKRLSRADLAGKYAEWDTRMVPTEHDTLWTDALESEAACAERGYDELRWLWEHAPEERVAVAAHGGMFCFLMRHPCVSADDHMRSRFHNCELRGCVMTVVGGAAEGRPIFQLTSTSLGDE